MGSIWALERTDSTPLQVVLAVLPVVPLLFALRAFLRFLSRIDELQQRIQPKRLGCRPAAGLVTITVGFLENAGLPQPSWIWVFPMLIAFWGIGTAIAGRRYQ
ncbi:MAG: hypothetical protein R2873_11535 [Caldilineaceae bacterium]